jgi:hypothetical protein
MAYQRRLVALDKALERVARGSCQDPHVTPWRRTWETRAEALCGGLAEGIITTPEVVMMD